MTTLKMVNADERARRPLLKKTLSHPSGDTLLKETLSHPSGGSEPKETEVILRATHC